MNLLDPQNWNLLRRASYEVVVTSRSAFGYRYEALRDVQLVARSPILMVGMKSERAKAHWKTGGWASQWLPILPGSTTAFTATVHSAQERCLLSQLNLIRFPYLGVSPYILNISFPYWIEEIYMEVWQFAESPSGLLEPPYTDMYQLSKQMAFLAQKDVPTQYDVEQK